MFWPNMNLLLVASALLFEFSKLKRRWAVNSGWNLVGNKRQPSGQQPAGFCLGHEVQVIEVTLRAGLDNLTEHRSASGVQQSPLFWPLQSCAKWKKRKGLQGNWDSGRFCPLRWSESGWMNDLGPSEADAHPTQCWAQGPRHIPGADILKEIVGCGWRF